MTHHDVRDHLQHLIVATAAAGGTVGDRFDTFKGSQDILKIRKVMEGIYNLAIANLLAITDHIIFNHSNTSC